MAEELEEAGRIFTFIRAIRKSRCVIVVPEGRQGRVPSDAPVSEVFEQAAGEIPVWDGVIMNPGDGVVGMRAICAEDNRLFVQRFISSPSHIGVGTYSQAFFFKNCVVECLAIDVLAEPVHSYDLCLMKKQDIC